LSKVFCGCNTLQYIRIHAVLPLRGLGISRHVWLQLYGCDSSFPLRHCRSNRLFCSCCRSADVHQRAFDRLPSNIGHHKAMLSASHTRITVIRSAITQPITRRENSSSTTAKYSQPSSVQIVVIFDTHFGSKTFASKFRPNRFGAMGNE